MKVLFINTVFGKGSTGRIIKDLGNQLEKEGHSYMVAYGRGDSSPDQHTYRIGGTISVCAHALLARLTDRAGFYSSHPTEKLVEFIRDYGPDVIHLHNLHGYYLDIRILFDYLKQEYKGKVIWTLHDCWAFTGHCVHFTYVGCEKWKSGCRDCPQTTEYPASWYADSSCRNYADKKRIFCGVPHLTIVTVSQWLKQMAEQSFLKEYPIRCVYNGIDAEVFRPVKHNVKQELHIENKKMILLVSDGWNNRKGYDKVLEIAAESPADWHYVMIGLSSKQRNNLPANITGIERIWDRDKLIEYYSAADVFFNPSVEETFGLVTAEALACGTPVVVMDSTACPEIITHPKYGVVVPVNAEAKDFITALQDCCVLPEIQSAVNNFSLSNFLGGYRDIFNNTGD